MEPDTLLREYRLLHSDGERALTLRADGAAASDVSQTLGAPANATRPQGPPACTLALAALPRGLVGTIVRSPGSIVAVRAAARRAGRV